MTPARASRRPAQGPMNRSAFDARVEKIETCLKTIEGEVATLKVQGAAGWPRLDRIEADLRETERELLLLKGQGQVHDARLVNIESALKDLHQQLTAHYEAVQRGLEQNRQLLADHTADEIGRFNKILWGVLSTLAVGLLSFLFNFVLKHV
jgi:chromosome segregation ATPase